MAATGDQGAHVDVHPLARELGERFREAGHQLYLVGGNVRDALMHRDPPDVDLDFATDAHPPETVKVLRSWGATPHLQGVRFGTVGTIREHRRIEITTFREEIYPDDERKPGVSFARDIETDLSRRDFTINAMAISLPEGAFVDPHGGVRDLAAKTLDTPLEPEVSFSDDPLRMLRAARFVSTLGVAPSRRVVTAMTAMHGRLEIVSAERIREELDKMLVGDEVSLGLQLIVETGLAEEFLPEVPALRLEQDPVHRHKDVLRHTYAVVQRCEPRARLRLAALLHDIGKPRTREITPDGVQFHHHEVVGARMANERMRALRYPNQTVDEVTKLVEMHLRFHTYEGWTDGAVRRYVRDAGDLLDDLNQLTRADCTTRNERKARQFGGMQDELEERIAALAEQEALDALRPPLDGNEVMTHLGLPPGPAVGEALDHLMEIRLERGPVPRQEALELLEAWARERGL
jgi:poly(A) polymerase